MRAIKKIIYVLGICIIVFFMQYRPVFRQYAQGILLHLKIARQIRW